MTNTSTPSAKEKVLQWVESKAGKAETLQELLIALNKDLPRIMKKNKDLNDDLKNIGFATTKLKRVVRVYSTGEIIYKENHAGLNKKTIQFDLTKNLHEQSDEFFEDFLPLISDE